MTVVLKNRIMRRVYMSFLVSLAEHRFFWRGFLFGASLALFGRAAHVAAIADNLLATPLGDLPFHIVNAFAQAVQNGQFLAVVAVLLMATIGVSFVRAFLRSAAPARLGT
jgi:hypothetical protein